MIPMADILEWRATHPWQTLSQVEQDLLLSRCIVDLCSRADVAQWLAMRGGTILHKLHCAPARRYSEDLDLVQVHAGPIGPIFDAVKDTLSPLLGKPKRDTGPGVATLTYSVPSECPSPSLRPKTTAIPWARACSRPLPVPKPSTCRLHSAQTATPFSNMTAPAAKALWSGKSR